MSRGASLFQPGDIESSEKLEAVSEAFETEESASFSILIMEKLGGLIPIGRRLPDKALYVGRTYVSICLLTVMALGKKFWTYTHI